MFLDSRQFDFVPALEAAWEAIKSEYIALPSHSFDPWVQRSMHGGGWSVFALQVVGQLIPQAGAACPKTVKALQEVPGLSMAGFSRLAPRTHVKPHVGWAASVYRLHLGLVVPRGCRLRVASETRTWEEGRCIVFDDTVEHEAWNDSEHPRGVLLLDFLRPGMAGSVADHVPEEVQQYAASLLGKAPEQVVQAPQTYRLRD
jgi:beta-hydroxylase